MLALKRILLIPGHGLGDCICFAAAVHILKRCYPDIIFDVLAYRSATCDLFAHNPDIRNIIQSPSETELLAMRKQYDFILCFPFIEENFQWIEKIGLKTYLPSAGDTPLAEGVLRLIQDLFPLCRSEKIERYYIYPQPEHFESAQNVLQQAGADLSGQEILIGCHIGDSGMAYRPRAWWKIFKKKYGRRVWPSHHYVALLEDLILRDPRIRLVLSGKLAEQAHIQKLFKKHRAYIYDISGKTSILTLAAMMKCFHGFLSTDTGPMHLATAMNIPQVALFGKHSYTIGQPYPPKPYRHIILKESVPKITVSEVADAVMRMIGEHTHAAL